MIEQNEVIEIGTLTKAHGKTNEVVLALKNDVLEALKEDRIVLECDAILVPFYMNAYRYKGDLTALLQLDNWNEATALRLLPCRVFALKKDLDEDLLNEPPETLVWSDLVGFEVFDANLGHLGKIKRVDKSTLNVLFELENGTLLPAHEDLIDALDFPNRTLHMSLPAGLQE